MKDGGEVRVLSYILVKVGNNLIGIYGSIILVIIENDVKVEVGDGGIGIYVKNGNVNLELGFKMIIGKILGINKEVVGVYYVGNGGIVNNNLLFFNIGKGFIGIVDVGIGVLIINNNLILVVLFGDVVYIYIFNINLNVIGNIKIMFFGNGNYGYYVVGNLINNVVVSINFVNGIGNVGIYSVYRVGGIGIVRNVVIIIVGKIDLENELYSIGMVVGYIDFKDISKNRVGYVINIGIINVGFDNLIGMYVLGVGLIVENDGIINIIGKKVIGMYLENGVIGINIVNGKIIIELLVEGVIVVYLIGKNIIFKNYGIIILKVFSLKGIVIVNDG